MQTNSNLTFSTSSTASANPVTELWLRLWLEIFEPDIIIFGLVTNSLVFLVMPQSKVKVGPSAKLYYVSLAISDFFALIVGWLLKTLISDSMYVRVKLLMHFKLITCSISAA